MNKYARIMQQVGRKRMNLIPKIDLMERYAKATNDKGVRTAGVSISQIISVCAKAADSGIKGVVNVPMHHDQVILLEDLGYRCRISEPSINGSNPEYDVFGWGGHFLNWDDPHLDFNDYNKRA